MATVTEDDLECLISGRLPELRRDVRRVDVLVEAAGAVEARRQRRPAGATGLRIAGDICPIAAAALMLTGGEDLAVISKVLGRADYGTTLKVYAHLDPKRAKVAAGRIDAALGRTLPTIEDVAT